MKKRDSGNTSKTNWDRLDSKSDKDIDTTDIPPLDDDFFSRAKWVTHRRQEQVTLNLDADLLDWFKAQDEAWQSRMNAALRIYVESHRQSGRESAA